MMQIKYEKLPRFCSHCGRMGHVHLECGSGEHEEETLEYGDWMVADFETWRPGTPRVRAPPATREARGGRAMGEGRGDRFPYRGGRTAGYGARSGARGVWKEKETRSEDSGHKEEVFY